MNKVETLQTLLRMFPLCLAKEFVTDYADDLAAFPKCNVYVETINNAKTEQLLRGAHLALGSVLRMELDAIFTAQRKAREAIPVTVQITPPVNAVTKPTKLSKKARAKLGMQPGEPTTQAHREAYAKMFPQAVAMPVVQEVKVVDADYVPPKDRPLMREKFFADARRITGTQMGITEKSDVLMKADMKAISLVPKHNVLTAAEVMHRHRNIIFANASSKAVFLAYLKAEMSENVALDAIKRALAMEHKVAKRAA